MSKTISFGFASPKPDFLNNSSNVALTRAMIQLLKNDLRIRSSITFMSHLNLFKSIYFLGKNVEHNCLFKIWSRTNLRRGKCSQVRIGNNILGNFEQWMYSHPVTCWPLCLLKHKLRHCAEAFFPLFGYLLVGIHDNTYMHCYFFVKRKLWQKGKRSASCFWKAELKGHAGHNWFEDNGNVFKYFTWK